MITKADIQAMFPDCGHRTGYGDNYRCEGMSDFCRARKAHRAGQKLLATIEALQKAVADREGFFDSGRGVFEVRDSVGEKQPAAGARRRTPSPYDLGAEGRRRARGRRS